MLYRVTQYSQSQLRETGNALLAECSHAYMSLLLPSMSYPIPLHGKSLQILSSFISLLKLRKTLAVVKSIFANTSPVLKKTCLLILLFCWWWFFPLSSGGDTGINRETVSHTGNSFRISVFLYSVSHGQPHWTQDSRGIR